MKVLEYSPAEYPYLLLKKKADALLQEIPYRGERRGGHRYMTELRYSVCLSGMPRPTG